MHFSVAHFIFAPTISGILHKSPLIITTVSDVQSILSGLPVAVSYTHLDVYKRQAVNGYCGGLLCLTCKLTVKVDCKEKPCDCKGSNWGEMYFAPSVASANVKATPIKCDGIYKLNCKQAYDINAFYNCVGKDCPGRVEYKLQAPDASIVTGTMPLVAFTPTQSGTYVLLLQGYCGDVLCNKCKIMFRVECPVDSNCCPYNISVKHTAPTYTSSATSTNVNTNYSITLPAAANIKDCLLYTSRCV